MNTSLGIIYSVIALTGFGLSNAAAKQPTQKLGPLSFYFCRNFFTSLILSLIILPKLFSANFQAEYLLFAILLSFFGFIPLYFFLKAIAVGKIGLVGPVAYTSSIFTILLSVVFYHESVNLIQAITFLVIITGVVLATVDIRDFKNSHLFNTSSGVPYALITSIGWGIFFFLNKIPVVALGSSLTAFIIELGGFIITFLILKAKKNKICLPAKPTLYTVLAVAILGVIGTLAFNFGVSTSDVSLVATISSATPLIALIYGRFVYKEKLTFLQYAAVALIITGIASACLSFKL